MARLRRAVVGKVGKWVKVTLAGGKKEEKWEQRELQGPVPWMVYKKTLRGDVVRAETNVRYVHRVWRRAVGDTGGGVLKESPITPWPVMDRYGRVDLRVDLNGLAKGKGAYLHHAAWYFLVRKDSYKSWVAFKNALKKDECRVDHVGGVPEVVNVLKLRLNTATESAEQGGSQRKAYRKLGSRVLTQRRLLKRS